MTRIEPYTLWVGHAGEGGDSARLAEAGIEAVVNLAFEDPPEPPPRGILFLRVPMIDGTGNRSAYIDLAVTTVANLLRLSIPTLVHCGAGMSRAPTIAAAAVSVAFGKKSEDCLRDIVARHPCDVSPGFWDEVKVVINRKTR
jgi:protein-tyrosine phosphatase